MKGEFSVQHGHRFEPLDSFELLRQIDCEHRKKELT